MIAGVEGILEGLGPDWAVIKVGGVSLRVYLSTFTLDKLGVPGDRVRLRTHLHWKEDNVALYGFTSEQELALFRQLISVNSVGPKLAMAMLSGMSLDQLALAIAGGNVDLLTRLPGVGKKTAARVVLELRSKLEKEQADAGLPSTSHDAEVAAALANLGYSAAEAARAVADIPRSPDLSLEEKVRLALRRLAT